MIHIPYTGNGLYADVLTMKPGHTEVFGRGRQRRQWPFGGRGECL